MFDLFFLRGYYVSGISPPDKIVSGNIAATVVLFRRFFCAHNQT
jgi:hypothetical protein